MKYEILMPQTIYEIGQRANQEDSIFPAQGQATASNRLFILCDGMGGHDKGEVASQTVCNELSSYIEKNFPNDQVFTDEQLNEAIAATMQQLEAKDTGAMKKMGTTLTFLYLHRGGATIAHIGDSRVYHLRPKTNEILYRTRDHSLVYDLFDVGELSLNELATAPNKNIITRVMMPGQERIPTATIAHVTNIQPDDYFFLCSDGMLEEMTDQQLMAILADTTATEEEKRERLIAASVNSRDNHSALIVKIQSVQLESGIETFEDTEVQMRERNRIFMAEQRAATATSVQSNAQTAPPPAGFSPAQQAEVHPYTGNDAADDDVVEVMPDLPMGNEPPIGQFGQPVQKPNSGKRFFFLLLFGAAIGLTAFFLYTTFIEKKEGNPTPEAQEEKIETKASDNSPATGQAGKTDSRIKKEMSDQKAEKGNKPSTQPQPAPKHDAQQQGSSASDVQGIIQDRQNNNRDNSRNKIEDALKNSQRGDSNPKDNDNIPTTAV